jgi:tetratricopeptide (TPR) repeat protein
MGAQVSRCSVPKRKVEELPPSPNPRLQLWAAAAARQAAKSGPDAPETLRTQTKLARALRATGAVGEATALLEDVLERQLAAQGEGGEDVLETQQILASLIVEERATARRPVALTLPSEAKPLLEDVVTKKKRGQAADLRAQADKHMGRGDTGAGNALAAYTEAVRLYGRAIELDPDDELLPTLNQLAKRKAKAERADGEAEDGEEHEAEDAEEEQPAPSARGFDPLTQGLGDYAAARPLEEAVVAGFASRFGEDDERTLTARMHLARTLRRLGDSAAARPEYEAVLAAKGESSPNASQRTSRAIAQANLALLLYEDLGEHAEGLRLMHEVVELWTAELGTAHPDTQQWAATLARWKAMTPMAPGAARAAAQAQLARESALAVAVEGLISLPDYNSVYLPADEANLHRGWPRFVSPEVRLA